MKNPLTPAGIEPATFRFVGQNLNHCATVVPSCKGNKLKFTLEQATKDQMGLYSFFNFGTSWGGWSMPRSGRFTPWKDLVLSVQEAGWAQVRSGRVRKISPLLGLDPRTVQPVASRYTD